MKTILFGNGLNYMSKSHISWTSLLDKIKGENLFENGSLPYTMIYERSILGSPISFDTLTKKEEAIKISLANMLNEFPSNIYFEKLSELNVQNYLTTNYDYAFLNVYQGKKNINIVNKSTEGIYSIRRHKDIFIDDKLVSKLWHIHGEIEVPPSIMLGLDQYCGSVAKIDNYVKGRYEYQEQKMIVRTPSISDKLSDKSKFDNSSWIELFFNSDIHIIGLGLDFSEIDLWWVLNKRARFMLENNTKELISNKIIYYTTAENEDQLNLLKALNIHIIKISLDGSSNEYQRAYDNILTRIKNS